MKDLVNKVALITGAGQGIGRALSCSLAQEGCRLVLVDIDPLALAEVADELAAQTAVLPLAADVTDEAAVNRFCATAVQEFGGVDILINNAGMAMGGFIDTVPLDQWRYLMDLNFWGYVYITRSLLPAMMARGSGHLVFVSSISGVATSPNSLPYSTSKFAVAALAESVAAYVRPHGVGVTLACPSTTRTNIAANGRYFFGEAQNGAAQALFQDSVEKGLSAEVVAAKIVNAVRKDQFLLLIPWTIRLIMLLRVLLPETYLRINGWFHHKEKERALEEFANPTPKETPSS